MSALYWSQIESWCDHAPPLVVLLSDGVRRIEFSGNISDYADISSPLSSAPKSHAAHRADRALRAWIDGWGRGQDVMLPPLDPVEVDQMGTCHAKILWRLAQSTRGQTVSYGELAEQAGYTRRHARAAGTAMSRNPLPVVIPCHRVIRSDGSIGHYGGGVSLKSMMLKKEGAVVK